MIRDVITFDRDLSQRELAEISEMWRAAANDIRKRDVILGMGGTVKRLDPSPRTRRAFLQRARAKVR